MKSRLFSGEDYSVFPPQLVESASASNHNNSHVDRNAFGHRVRELESALGRVSQDWPCVELGQCVAEPIFGKHVVDNLLSVGCPVAHPCELNG